MAKERAGRSPTEQFDGAVYRGADRLGNEEVLRRELYRVLFHGPLRPVSAVSSRAGCPTLP